MLFNHAQGLPPLAFAKIDLLKAKNVWVWALKKKKH